MELHEDLGNGMVMRRLHDEADERAFIGLNDAVIREGPICDRLVRHGPGSRRQDFFVVEDTRTGRTAMLEMVVTHPDYRRLGLVRAQVAVFHRIAEERGMDLCIIQGIPWYYRQFSYAYALDHRPLIRLPAGAIPDAWRPANRSAPGQSSPRRTWADMEAAPRAVIGSRFFCLSGSIVNHDCSIGEDACICSGVRLAGHVRVEDSCCLGQGCNVKQRVTIGERSLVGMGSVVLKDVPPGSVMAGNPARRLRDRVGNER